MLTLKQKLSRLAIAIKFAIGIIISLAIVTPVIADDSATNELAVEIIAENLDHPWSLAFLPDGRLLVTERSGKLRIVDQGQVSEPLANVPPVYAKARVV